jgi:hypothetical protein
MTDQKNPYASTVPAESDRHESANATEEFEAIEDVIGNLAFTAKIVKISSVCSGLASVFYGCIWFLGFNYLVPFEYWGWLEAVHVFRITFVIAFALLAWRGWIYGSAISRIRGETSPEFIKYVESQTWLWLAIGFLVFLLLAGTGLSFSASYVYSNGFW